MKNLFFGELINKFDFLTIKKSRYSIGFISLEVLVINLILFILKLGYLTL